jgi:hypothetical protein
MHAVAAPESGTGKSYISLISPRSSLCSLLVCLCVPGRGVSLVGARKLGGSLENAALMANHASTRTTQLYDRRSDEVTLDEVEGSGFERVAEIHCTNRRM